MSLYLKGWHTVKRDGMTITVHSGEAMKLARITCVVLAITSDQRRTWKRACEKLGINASPVGCDCAATGIKAHAPTCPCGKGSERYDTDTGELIGERPPATVTYSCQGIVDSLRTLVDKTPIVQRVVFGEANPTMCKGSGGGDAPKRQPRPIQERYVACQQSAMRNEKDIAVDKGKLSTLDRCDILLHTKRGDAIDTPVPAKPRGEYDKPKKPGKVSMSQYESLVSSVTIPMMPMLSGTEPVKSEPTDEEKLFAHVRKLQADYVRNCDYRPFYTASADAWMSAGDGI